MARKPHTTHKSPAVIKALADARVKNARYAAREARARDLARQTPR